MESRLVKKIEEESAEVLPDVPTQIKLSENESAIKDCISEELRPYIKVIRPTRPSLTYDRME